MPVQLVQAIDKRAAERRLKRADIVREILWREVERQSENATPIGTVVQLAEAE